MGGRELLDAMAAPAMVMMARAYNWTANSTSSSLSEQAATSKHDNATLALISSLVFAESKSVRTSTIILAAFNILAGFTTASSILYDCYWASKRCNPKFKASKFCVSSIHPAETFPLVLSIGIVIQGLVFAGVQGEGLQSLFTKGCHTIAQFMWPALFIVPYIQLVFGLECTLRSLRALPFQARGKYDVTICCGTIALMLIITWIPSNIFPEPDTCFASLVWFISNYGLLGSIILTVAAGLMIISALTIFIRLSAVNLINEHQRIAASRMVYYLVLGIVQLAFVIPYFFSIIHHHGELKLAMMATVVLNLSGLMSGLLQLFLRSNTSTTSFGPKLGRNWERGKHEIRIFGPNELALHQHLVDPVTGPGTTRDQIASRSDSQAELVRPEKGRVISMESLRSPPPRSMEYFDKNGAMPDRPEPLAIVKSPTAAGRGHAKKPSYSVFPFENLSPTKPAQQPISIYDISGLEPPPSIHHPGGLRHERNSSVASSATVQIGLRLSHAPGVETQAPPLLSTTYTPNSYNPSNTLSPDAGLALPATTYSSAPKGNAIQRPNLAIPPLLVETNIAAPAPPPRSSRRPAPSPLNPASRSPEPSPKQAFITNKSLPPTPKAFLSAIEKVRESSSNIQLSPTVYTPTKKLAPSPAPATLAREGTPVRSNPSGSPRQAPPVQRSNSGRAPLVRANTKDWI